MIKFPKERYVFIVTNGYRTAPGLSGHNDADNTVQGVSDITEGVKKDAYGIPENRTASEYRDACGTNGADFGADMALRCESGGADAVPEESSHPTAVLSSSVSDIGDGESRDEEKRLDAEFEALIKGKYRNAYKKRTENIVRRRLKSVKNSADAVSDGEKAVPTESQAPKRQNIARPAENGVGGSVGVYTRINVSAITGKDVREIMERAASGERITFR